MFRPPLTFINTVTYHSQVRILRREFAEDFWSAVGGAIVHANHLEVRAVEVLFASTADAPRDVIFDVIGWDDDAEKHCC